MTIEGVEYRKVDGAYAHLGWQRFNKGPGGSGWTSISEFMLPFLDRIAELEGQIEECNQVRFHYFQGR